MANSPRQIDVKKSAPAPKPSSGPLHPFQSLRQQIDRVFEDFDRGTFPGRWLSSTPFARTTTSSGTILPAIDIADEDTAYRVTAELPGISEKEIEVTKHGDLLTIKGQKKDEWEKKGKGYYMAERHFGSFERSLRLPGTVDDAKIDAKFANGVLTVILPKSAATTPKPKKIEIKGG
ncbi:Hsp20/alpha crystallin family protein [Dongia sp.]|uniref:Hsp20/alpha crystallin family protein n=1 Tax=Dongia sp. TaxID=1977262 RepID=UPI0035AEAF06